MPFEYNRAKPPTQDAVEHAHYLFRKRMQLRPEDLREPLPVYPKDTDIRHKDEPEEVWYTNHLLKDLYEEEAVAEHEAELNRRLRNRRIKTVGVPALILICGIVILWYLFYPSLPMATQQNAKALNERLDKLLPKKE